MSERERKDHTNNYTSSLLTRATSSPQKTIGYSLSNQQQITTHHNLKEVILITQEHTLSLTSHTQSEQPSDLTVTQFTRIQTKEQLQENMEQITPDYRKSQLLLIYSLTKAQPKTILLS